MNKKIYFLLSIKIVYFVENNYMAKHGGKRNNAGRKKVKDKKIQLSIYPLTSQVKAAGGEKKAKKVALEAIEQCG